ncbi:adhesion G-protein coupled receptor D2 [Mus pahari]|uniref:adhesion G-protein coupled receptor D2 n=1 Tax=Mus pahari TaxID=10093 RepID=UPI000A310B02|nr:adhesion G-protein coupled receptor D2 [Mus pahari]
MAGPVADRETEALLPVPTGEHTTAALVFHERTADRAARLLTVLPELAALTACVHVQWDETATEAVTLFSLATLAVANALQLRAFAEPGGYVRAALVVRGHHAPFNAIFRSDSRWHHVCATWEQRSGHWALFTNGRRCAEAQGLSVGHPVPPDGVLVLGQDQDSLDGGFLARDAFSGNLTDFYLWDQVLSLEQVRRARACTPPPEGLFFQWDPEALDIMPSLLPTVLVRLLCPVPSEECPTWNPGPGTKGSEFCVHLQLFLCCYPKDKASSFLGRLARVLAEKPGPLGPVTLLAILHFLKRVAALRAEEPELPTQPWEELGRSFVSVASLTLEEQSASAWLSICESYSGGEDKSAIQLDTPEESLPPEIQLLPHLIPGLEVQNLHLREASTGGHTFTIPAGIQMDQATSTSLQVKSLSTQVGSAILSSEVRDAAGELSTAVTFHLQHQAQVFPKRILEPVCAFWNFSANSDAGGSWATTGCSVLTLHPDSTTCFCKHSTSFAILLQVHDVQGGPEEESLLRTLSFVGCGVSLCGVSLCGVSLCALATTFLLIVVAGVPPSERTTIHKNLILSLASAEGFLMTSEWAKTNKVTCVAVTAAMHLLFLVASSWMLAEGLLLWNKVVAVSMHPGPRMRLYYAAGWGIPVAIVAITLALHPHDYVASGHCWINVHTDTIWAFVGPVLFVLTANTYILVRAVMVTVSSTHRRARMLSPQPDLQQKIKFQMWAMVKPVLALLPVLGLTWLFGLLVHISPIWAYAAVLLNSFQGPYIFLIYAAYNGEVGMSQGWTYLLGSREGQGLTRATLQVQSALRRMTEKKAAEVLRAEQVHLAKGFMSLGHGPGERPSLGFSGKICCSQRDPWTQDSLSLLFHYRTQETGCGVDSI